MCSRLFRSFFGLVARACNPSTKGTSASSTAIVSTWTSPSRRPIVKPAGDNGCASTRTASRAIGPSTLDGAFARSWRVTSRGPRSTSAPTRRRRPSDASTWWSRTQRAPTRPRPPSPRASTWMTKRHPPSLPELRPRPGHPAGRIARALSGAVKQPVRPPGALRRRPAGAASRTTRRACAAASTESRCALRVDRKIEARVVTRTRTSTEAATNRALPPQNTRSSPLPRVSNEPH